MIPPVNSNSAARAQKNPLGMAVLLLVSVTIGAFSAYMIMSNGQTKALNRCQEEKNQLVRDVMMKAGLIRDVNQDTTYKHIADSINRLLTRKFEDKEITTK